MFIEAFDKGVTWRYGCWFTTSCIVTRYCFGACYFWIWFYSLVSKCEVFIKTIRPCSSLLLLDTDITQSLRSPVPSLSIQVRKCWPLCLNSYTRRLTGEYSECGKKKVQIVVSSLTSQPYQKLATYSYARSAPAIPKYLLLRHLAAYLVLVLDLIV